MSFQSNLKAFFPLAALFSNTPKTSINHFYPLTHKLYKHNSIPMLLFNVLAYAFTADFAIVLTTFTMTLAKKGFGTILQFFY